MGKQSSDFNSLITVWPWWATVPPWVSVSLSVKEKGPDRDDTNKQKGLVWCRRELERTCPTSLLLRNVGSELPAVLVSHKKWWKTKFLWEFPVSKISNNPNLKSLFGPKKTFPVTLGLWANCLQPLGWTPSQMEVPLPVFCAAPALALRHCIRYPRLPWATHIVSSPQGLKSQSPALSCCRADWNFFLYYEKESFLNGWQKSRLYLKQIALKCMWPKIYIPSHFWYF